MYDLLIKEGKLVTGEVIDLAIRNGKIVAIGTDLQGTAKKTIELAQASYLSAGWIDSHVHCFEKMTLYYDEPDKVGVETGVTTVIDAGSTGPANVGDFYECSRNSRTNVLALLNISEWGIVAQNELADLTKINSQLIHQAFQAYPEFIVGLKARMSKTVVGQNDIIPLEMAKKIQKELKNPPLMVHIGSAPPELSAVLSRLEAGDVVTHCFNGKSNGILGSTDSIKSFVWEAYQKGVVFDIGHGTDSFNFHVAEIALQEKMVPRTISTDIYHRNRENGPVHNLATTLEKMLEVGYSLEELISKITIEPAAIFKLANKGQLKVDYDGDLTIFKVEHGERQLVDSNGNQRLGKMQVVPEQAIVGGNVYVIK